MFVFSARRIFAASKLYLLCSNIRKTVIRSLVTANRLIHHRFQFDFSGVVRWLIVKLLAGIQTPTTSVVKCVSTQPLILWFPTPSLFLSFFVKISSLKPLSHSLTQPRHYTACSYLCHCLPAQKHNSLSLLVLVKQVLLVGILSKRVL